MPAPVPPSSAHVLHVGPDPAFVGGMGTVIRLMVEESVGLPGRVVPTWRPTSRPDQVRLVGRALARLARSEPDAVVHVHLSHRGSFVREGAVLIAARARGRAVVAQIHGDDFVPFANAHPRATAAVLRRAHIVTCLTTETHDVVSGLLPGADVRMVSNPLPSDPTSTPARDTDEVVLFAGEIGTRKGADVLAAAWSQVAASRPTARCVLVGPTTDLTMPELDRLELREPVGPEAMRELLRSARVVALPSRSESLPMILLEAIGARRPFVSTTVGEIPLLARGGNVLVAPEDADGLARGLMGFLADPELAERVGERAFAATANGHAAELDRRWNVVYCDALAAARGAARDASASPRPQPTEGG